jgi:hypothetical protein
LRFEEAVEASMQAAFAPAVFTPVVFGPVAPTVAAPIGEGRPIAGPMCAAVSA